MEITPAFLPEALSREWKNVTSSPASLTRALHTFFGVTPKPAGALEAEPGTNEGDKGMTWEPWLLVGQEPAVKDNVKSSGRTIRLNLGQAPAPLCYSSLTLSNLFKTSVNSAVKRG